MLALSVSSLSAWAFIKHLAHLVLAGGLLMNVFAPTDRRPQAVYLLITPGLLVSWWAGYGMAHATGLSLSTPWISAALATSLASFTMAVWSVEQPGRVWAGWVAVALHVATLALMVFRPGLVP